MSVDAYIDMAVKAFHDAEELELTTAAMGALEEGHPEVAQAIALISIAESLRSMASDINRTSHDDEEIQ